MNITKVLSKYQQYNQLDVYIGKSLNRQAFQTHNKLWFEMFFNFLKKNDWTINNQMIQKIYQLDDNEWIYASLINPNDLIQRFEKRSKETHHKYKGSYYDLMIHGYHTDFISKDSIDPDSIICESFQEVTILQKNKLPFEIFLIIEKYEDKEYHSAFIRFYNLKDSLESFKNEINEIIQIIDLSMCKYKKIDQIKDSSFEMY